MLIWVSVQKGWGWDYDETSDKHKIGKLGIISMFCSIDYNKYYFNIKIEYTFLTEA